MSDLHRIAKRIEKQGRGGDSTLMHVNKQELKTLEALLGEITTNPETGLPEAFAWKKLLTGLAAAGLIAAAIPTGGTSLLAGLGIFGGLGAGAAGALSVAGGAVGAGLLGKALKPGVSKDASASQAGDYLAAAAAKRKEGHYDFAPPMRMVSSPMQPDLYGRQRNNYIAPMGARNPLAGIADNVDASIGYAKGGAVTEESAKEQVLALLAKLQAQQQGQPIAPGRMVKGIGSGLSDSIPADLSDGEYVVPADVVSMMGDGSTDAGGRQLDNLVAKVRVQKTGSRKQAGKMRIPRGMRMQHG